MNDRELAALAAGLPSVVRARALSGHVGRGGQAARSAHAVRAVSQFYNGDGLESRWAPDAQGAHEAQLLSVQVNLLHHSRQVESDSRARLSILRRQWPSEPRRAPWQAMQEAS